MMDLSDLQSDVHPGTTPNHEHSEDVCETRDENWDHEKLNDFQQRNARLEEENNHLKKQCKTLEIELELKKKIIERKDKQLAKKEDEVFHYADSLANIEKNYKEAKQSIEERLELSNNQLAREKQRRKDLDDIYNGILKEKNIELWALKQIKLQKQDLERKNKELSERLSKEEALSNALKESLKNRVARLSKEEALSNALKESLKNREARLSDEEAKVRSLKRQTKESHSDLKDYLIRLSNEEALSNSLKESLKNREASYQTLRKEYNNYIDETAMKTGQMINKYRKLQEDYEKYVKDKEEEKAQIINCYQNLRADYNKYVKEKEEETKQILNSFWGKHNEMTSLQKELEDTKSRLANVQKELRDTKTRLASVFQKRLLIDQRRVENTVECNTPSDVEKDFKHFFAEDRIDALDIIENTIPSTEESDLQARYLACLIFVAAYEEVEEAKEATRDLLNNIIRQLILDVPRTSQELCHKRKESVPCSELPIAFSISVKKEELEDPPDFMESLMLSLKKTAHVCDLKCFENTVKKVVLEKWMKCQQEESEMRLLPEPELSEKVISELDDYIKACIRLCWRLVTQLPPLQLEYSCLKFNKQKHRITRFFYNLEGPDIACYLWPALLEQGGRVVSHAEVICKPENS